MKRHLLLIIVGFLAISSSCYFYNALVDNNKRGSSAIAKVIEFNNRWKLTHKKLYATPAENTYRLIVFKDQLEYIERINKEYEAEVARVGGVLEGPMFEMNKFGDLTNEEFKARFAGGKNTGLSEEDDNLHSSEATEDQHSQILYNDHYLGDEKPARSLGANWADYKFRLRDQRNCGSCWAFAAVATMEKFHFDKTGSRLDFSVQELVDCDLVNAGCEGGHPELAFKYVKENGIALESQYPYKAYRANCLRDKSKSVMVGIVKPLFGIYLHSTAIKAYNAGVMTTASVYSGGSFRFASSSKDPLDPNILGECKQNTDHVVNIVKADSDSVHILNSWGWDWGMQGFKTIKVCSEFNLYGAFGRLTHPYGSI